MSRERFEITKVLVPLTWKKEGVGLFGGWAPGYPVSDADTQRAWDKAAGLSNEGWELITSVPLISTMGYIGSDSEPTFPYTNGYILIFQRRIQE